MVPFPSASTSLITSCSYASVGFFPNDLITVPSSIVAMQLSIFVEEAKSFFELRNVVTRSYSTIFGFLSFRASLQPRAE
ncbi:hypothetical protein GOP47_0010727, partial [Adiantum capillus-veneris]